MSRLIFIYFHLFLCAHTIQLSIYRLAHIILCVNIFIYIYFVGFADIGTVFARDGG